MAIEHTLYTWRFQPEGSLQDPLPQAVKEEKLQQWQGNKQGCIEVQEKGRDGNEGSLYFLNNFILWSFFQIRVEVESFFDRESVTESLTKTKFKDINIDSF